jgi:hypothetical protein
MVGIVAMYPMSRQQWLDFARTGTRTGKLAVTRAEAQFSGDPDALLTWATRIGGRYMGPDRADEFGRRNAVPSELLVRGRITRVIAYADVVG